MPNIYKISQINPEKEAREHQIKCAFIIGWNNNSLFWQRVWFSFSHAKPSAWLEHQETWPYNQKNNKNAMETLFWHACGTFESCMPLWLLCGHHDILNVFRVLLCSCQGGYLTVARYVLGGWRQTSPFLDIIQTGTLLRLSGSITESLNKWLPKHHTHQKHKRVRQWRHPVNRKSRILCS